MRPAPSGPRLLRKWRTSQKYSQERAASLFGVCQTTVSDLEAGTVGVGLDVAMRIAKVTGGAVPAEAWMGMPVRKAPRPTTKTKNLRKSA